MTAMCSRCEPNGPANTAARAGDGKAVDQPVKFWTWKRIIIACLILPLISFLPLPVNEKDHEKIARKILDRVLYNKRVLVFGNGRLSLRYEQIYDTGMIGSGRVYFQNELSCRDEIFTGCGMIKIDDLDKIRSGVCLYFGQRDFFKSTSPVNGIWFGTYFGPLGATAYKLMVYKTIWGYFIVFKLAHLS